MKTRPLSAGDRCIILPIKGNESPNVGFTVTLKKRSVQTMEHGQWWEVAGVGLKAWALGKWVDSDTVKIPQKALQRIDPDPTLLPAKVPEKEQA